MKSLNVFAQVLLLLSVFSCKKPPEFTDNLRESDSALQKNKASAMATYNMVVAKDGSGNYTTVQAAFNAVPDNSSNRTVIYIKNGVYKELLTLASSKKNVTIIGESVAGVKLTYDNYATKINPATGLGYGTSGSASTFMFAEGFYAVNITFENSSGPVGPALAINIGGDKAVFNNCRFLGRQDAFYGARCRQYLKDCYLEGSTDFIFGPSTAVFESCKLYSYGGSALTAASTEPYVQYGYVFLKCNITGASGVQTALGRPWGNYAAVAFLYTAMTSVIKPAGWDNWGDPNKELTARYGEYRNNGDGSIMTSRPAWIKRITSTEALNYTITNVLKTTYTNPVTTDNWDPTTVISTTGATIN